MSSGTRPATCEGRIISFAKQEANPVCPICTGSGAIRNTQREIPGALIVYTDRIEALSSPVTDHRIIASRRVERDRNIRKASRIVQAEVEYPGPENADRIFACGRLSAGQGGRGRIGHCRCRR